MSSYYIYGHYKPNEDRPFYVGKGTGQRKDRKNSRSKHWHNIVNKYFSDTKFPIVKLLSENIESEELAFNLEKFWIALFGRKDLRTGTLINRTNGGEGGEGCHASANVRQKMSIFQQARFSNKKNRDKLSRRLGFYGCWLAHPVHGNHWCENQTEFSRHWNLYQGSLSQVINKKRVSHKLWHLVEKSELPKTDQQLKKEKGIRLSKAHGFTGCWLFHKQYGRYWCENQSNFSRHWNLNQYLLSLVIRKKKPFHKGWVLVD